jgi:hypothetical protein
VAGASCGAGTLAVKIPVPRPMAPLGALLLLLLLLPAPWGAAVGAKAPRAGWGWDGLCDCGGWGRALHTGAPLGV